MTVFLILTVRHLTWINNVFIEILFAFANSTLRAFCVYEALVKMWSKCDWLKHQCVGYNCQIEWQTVYLSSIHFNLSKRWFSSWNEFAIFFTLLPLIICKIWKEIEMNRTHVQNQYFCGWKRCVGGTVKTQLMATLTNMTCESLKLEWWTAREILWTPAMITHSCRVRNTYFPHRTHCDDTHSHSVAPRFCSSFFLRMYENAFATPSI